MPASPGNPKPMFQEQAGHPISHVEIPAADNATAIYAGAAVKGAPHPDAAKAWLDFIHSPEALQIFERYGFKPYGSPLKPVTTGVSSWSC